MPIILVSPLKKIYLWWLNWDFAYAGARWVMLEITPPREVLVPFKAMEDVFAMIWPVWDHPVFREKWCDGILDHMPGWCSFELASIEGKIHFYLRCLAQHKLMIETALYSHYPDIEIHETEDYVGMVPPSLPNEEWDTYGENFILDNSNNALPIKTYEKFFEPQGERIAAEEKRIDPMISLLEGLSRLGPGEHYWVQFVLMPIRPEIEDLYFLEGAREIINKITNRPQKKKTNFWGELVLMGHHLIFGPQRDGSGESAKYSWLEMGKSETGEREMVLTPGEREVLTEVENKIKKPVFKVIIRGVYVAKKENSKNSHKVLARSYFAHFGVQNMNFIRFDALTRPKIHNFMRNRRTFLRNRKIFKMAVLRFPPLFPNREAISSIFNTEELATIFHFPLRVSGMVGPTMEKVDSKKAGPPPNLPI